MPAISPRGPPRYRKARLAAPRKRPRIAGRGLSPHCGGDAIRLAEMEPEAQSRNTASGGRLMRTSTASEAPAAPRHHFRFHESHAHLSSAFGDDWFGVRAEGFARFFGTPTFLIGQTILVAFWIALNVAGLTKFDVYPFILLNLAFSLQAAYAAPLILLAQTRQSDRDKALADADAMHREDLAKASIERHVFATR